MLETLPRMYHVHRYLGSGNIGDAIQTIALERLLPEVAYVWRHHDSSPLTGTFVVNGWLGQNQPITAISDCLFAGVFVNDNEENYKWMAASRFGEIGARDPVTSVWCADRNIRAKLIGCATLTFDRYHGPRQGRYLVDAGDAVLADSVRLSHTIGNLSWPEQMRIAADLLRKYQTAELVVTSRLHVALPCLAFGTPVVITDPIGRGHSTIRRFSILDALGVSYSCAQVVDVSQMRHRYLAFLEKHLGIAIRPREMAVPSTLHN